MSKYKLKLKPFSDGKLIHAYESNPEFGYVVLESDEPFYCPTLLYDVNLKSGDVKSFKFPKRQVFLRGSIERLERLVDITSVNNLPGRIRITEYLEDEIPEDVKKANIRDDIPFEEAIKPYLVVYKPKNDSIENRIRDRFREKSDDKFLTKKGKRIVRFFIYQVDNKADLLIKGWDRFDTKRLLEDALTFPSFKTIEELEEEQIFGKKNSMLTVKQESISKVKSIEKKEKGVVSQLKENNSNMYNQEFRKVYYECVKQLIDANTDLFKKSNPCHEISFKTELEIALYTCAFIENNNPLNSTSANYEIYKETLIEILKWMFSQHMLLLPPDYFGKRLSEYKFDINSCYSSAYNLPLYSYYSLFKSPLRQFELDKVNDYDIMELYKFKFFMFQISDMNRKSAEFLFKTLNNFLYTNS